MSTHDTAEIGVTKASQSTVFGLHVKVKSHFLPQCRTEMKGEEENYSEPRERKAALDPLPLLSNACQLLGLYFCTSTKLDYTQLQRCW